MDGATGWSVLFNVMLGCVSVVAGVLVGVLAVSVVELVFGSRGGDDELGS